MKTTVKTMLWILCLLLALSFPVKEVLAVDDNDDPAEEVLFSSSIAPDVLLLLDLSGSMTWNAAGGAASSTNPSRLSIAKQAIFALLDYNGDGTINSADQTGLNVRFGYMRFYNCSSEDSTIDYSSGCNKLHFALGSGAQTGTAYSYIYCRSNTQCVVTDNCKSGTVCVNRESASNGTPLASALKEANQYLTYHRDNKDGAYKDCRKKYVILISDGADTYTCSGNGDECQATSYKRRREVVLQAKALKDAGFRVFVIGLGENMPDYLKNTLNWMAYFGGTDNAQEPNTVGSTGYLDLAGLTSCKVENAADLEDGICYSGGAGSTIKWKAKNNDPGYKDLSGYAFMAGSAEDLSKALKAAVHEIVSAIYSFSEASIQASRTEDENFLYEGSFEPRDEDSFWKGHLRQFPILSDGTVGPEIWNAGTELAKRDAASRGIYTYKGGSGGALTEFNTTNILPADLEITTGTAAEQETKRNEIVGFIRGESAFNNEEATINGTTYIYKLGDVFRTTPVTIGTPSPFYDDNRDTTGAFATHRSSHIRETSLGNRVVTVGTNNGQFHAFTTHNGAEAWSFIPPNLMSKFQLIAHKAHPTALTHHYFIDGPLSGAEAWLGSGDGTTKNPADWKTILVFGEGRGAVNYSWSSSDTCSTGINATYDESGSVKYKYYCGYHALNATNSPSVPTYLWNISFADSARSSQAPYFGDPWSKMQLGRIRINVGGVDTEKWVGFVGGGYNANDLKSSTDKRGKGVFVVDLTNGQVIWSFTHGSSITATTHSAMDYSIPAGPSIVDTDNDGFIDRAYIGDLGGNVWRFSFCRNADITSPSSCGIANWSGNMFFDSSTGSIRPIYTVPSAAKDTKGNLWLYWGTGDKNDPTAPNAQEHFYGVKDLDRTATYTVNNIDTLSSINQVYDPNSGKVGYRVQLNGQGEKVLSDPMVFGGVVYFTTYVPPDASNPCLQAGSAYIYGIKYTTGGCALGDKCNLFLGVGMSSSPIISVGPDGKRLYVTVSGGAGVGGQTIKVPHTPAGRSNMTNVIYWKDRRIE